MLAEPGRLYPSNRRKLEGFRTLPLSQLSQWLPRRMLLEDPERLPCRSRLLTQCQFRETIFKNLKVPTAMALRGWR